MASITRLLEAQQFDDVSDKYRDVCDENNQLRNQLHLLQLRYDRLMNIYQTQQMESWNVDIMNK